MPNFEEMEQELAESISKYLSRKELKDDIYNMNKFLVDMLCKSITSAYLKGYIQGKDDAMKEEIDDRK